VNEVQKVVLLNKFLHFIKIPVDLKSSIGDLHVFIK
jgi:hypothetical protein